MRDGSNSLEIPNFFYCLLIFGTFFGFYQLVNNSFFLCFSSERGCIFTTFNDCQSSSESSVSDGTVGRTTALAAQYVLRLKGLYQKLRAHYTQHKRTTNEKNKNRKYEFATWANCILEQNPTAVAFQISNLRSSGFVVARRRRT